MRVSIFVWGVARGAFARVAAGLSKGFVQQGVEVDVVYVNRDNYSQDLDFSPEARLLHLGPRRTIVAVPALARYLRGRRPDVLISLSWVQNSPAVVAKILSGWRGNLLLNEGGNLLYESAVEHRGDVRFRYMPYIARLLYPKSNGLVFPSQDLLSEIDQSIGLSSRGLPLRAIANPVDIDAVRMKATDEPEKLDLVTSATPVVLGIGRLARQKNFALLIRAFARLLKERPARLLILGSGPEEHNLRALIARLGLESDIFMPGMVRNPFAYMARADLLALSSKEEGCPLVLLEAMAVGLPIVATRCPGGPAEILQDGKSGILVTPGNEREMANALLELLDDGPRRQELAKAGIRRAEDFSPKRIASQWLSFMADVSRTQPTDGNASRTNLSCRNDC